MKSTNRGNTWEHEEETGTEERTNDRNIYRIRESSMLRFKKKS